MTVGVLLLAAGRSRRFGGDKRRAVLPGGQSLLATTIRNIKVAGLPLRLCLAASDVVLIDELIEELNEELSKAGIGEWGESTLDITLCQKSEQGMGATLAEGAAAITGWTSTIIALADMPWVTPATFIELAAMADPTTICVPVSSGRRGNPVCFGQDFYPDLAQCTGDTGARGLLREHDDRVIELHTDDDGIFRDIDRPEQMHGDC